MKLAEFFPESFPVDLRVSQFLRLLPYHHVNIFSATPTPELPPRPVSLEDVSYSDLDQHKSDINSAKVPSSPKHQVPHHLCLIM